MIAAHTRNARWMIVPAVALSFGLLGARCGGGGFQVTVNTPSHGDFITSANVTVSGTVNASNPQLASLTVNGTSVLPVGPGGTWSLSLPLDQVAIFNSILVEGVRTNGVVSRKVVTVHYGDHVDDGDFSPMGVALRLNDSGLDEVEPLVVGGVNLDIGAFVTVGTFVANIVSGIWEWDVYIGGPAPSTSGFTIDINSQTNSVRGDIDINGLLVHLDLQGQNWLTSNCTADLTTSGPLEVNGNYDLRADPFDPSVTDVEQVGNVSFGSTQFNIDITSGFVCEIGSFFGLIGDNISGDIQSGLSGFLNDPDGPDNPPGAHPLDGPIADEIELALADIEISGPIGQSLGVNLETPLFDVFEDDDGITLDSDARITALLPDPNAVDIVATYHKQEIFPTYSANSPVLGQPYDLAIGISTSAFNQLLKAEVESGLLITTISELAVPPLIPVAVPITAGLLGLLVPEFATLPPGLLLFIDIKPLLSPIVTGEAGPGGEIADLRIGGLHATVRGENSVTYLTVIVNAEVGLGINFVAGELSFSLGTPTANDVEAFVELNPLNANPTTLEQDLLPALVASALPDLASSLGTFPLPDFLGLSLDLVEIAKSGEYMSLFLNLTPAP